MRYNIYKGVLVLGFGVPLSPLMVLHPHFLAVNGGVVLEALRVQL